MPKERLTAVGQLTNSRDGDNKNISAKRLANCYDRQEKKATNSSAEKMSLIRFFLYLHNYRLAGRQTLIDNMQIYTEWLPNFFLILKIVLQLEITNKQK